MNEQTLLHKKGTDKHTHTHTQTLIIIKIPKQNQTPFFTNQLSRRFVLPVGFPNFLEYNRVCNENDSVGKPKPDRKDDGRWVKVVVFLD